jgi:hypothetical protein
VRADAAFVEATHVHLARQFQVDHLAQGPGCVARGSVEVDMRMPAFDDGDRSQAHAVKADAWRFPGLLAQSRVSAVS